MVYTREKNELGIEMLYAPSPPQATSNGTYNVPPSMYCLQEPGQSDSEPAVEWTPDREMHRQHISLSEPLRPRMIRSDYLGLPTDCVRDARVQASRLCNVTGCEDFYGPWGPRATKNPAI